MSIVLNNLHSLCIIFSTKSPGCTVELPKLSYNLGHDLGTKNWEPLNNIEAKSKHNLVE